MNFGFVVVVKVITQSECKPLGAENIGINEDRVCIYIIADEMDASRIFHRSERFP